MRTIELMEIEFVFIINTSKKNKTIYQTVYMLFYKKKKNNYAFYDLFWPVMEVA